MDKGTMIMLFATKDYMNTVGAKFKDELTKKIDADFNAIPKDGPQTLDHYHALMASIGHKMVGNAVKFAVASLADSEVKNA